MFASAMNRLTPEALVWGLTVMAATGITAVLPVLPLYAKGMGADVHFIGGMMAAYWAMNLICLPLGGWLSDRWGRRPVMLAGLLGHTVASAGFLLTDQTALFLVLRGIEGFAGACFMPAAMAYIADRAPLSRQGERMAHLAAAENAGMLLGPIIGGALAGWFGLGAPFAALTALGLLGVAMVLRLPAPQRRPATPAPKGPDANRSEIRWGLAIGVAVRALGAGFSFGMLEVVWPLYLTNLGASIWQISLSWTLFAVPMLILSRWVGPLIDRFGAGRPAVFGAAFSALVLVCYPLAGGPWMAILLSMIEGIGFAFSYPGQNALLIQVAPERLRGRTIGLIGTVRTVGAVVGSLVTPYLFAISAGACFGTSALIIAVGMAGLAIAIHRDQAPANKPATVPSYSG